MFSHMLGKFAKAAALDAAVSFIAAVAVQRL